jgi:hypothetical protein
MAVRDDFAPGEVLAAADLNDTFGSKVDYATPTNAQTGTTYTFVAADANRITTASNASAVTFTIPPQTDVAWAANAIIRVVNYGAGALTVAGGSGVTVTNTATVINQYGGGAAIRTGSDAWTFVPFGAGEPPTVNVEYLVIAGGGGGSLGGGGAGGYRCSVSGETSGGGASAESPFTATKGTTYIVTVGAGGGQNGLGNNSEFDTIVSTGGGVSTTNGGSGGGVGANDSSLPTPGAGTTGQGTAGGAKANTGARGGGGGGGASAAGAVTSGNVGGVGGNGVASLITGSSVTRGGGGGGGSSSGGPVSGGSGGGGAGASSSNTGGGNGTANTGGGGGGNWVSTPLAGGSGIVIVRFDDSKGTASTTGSPGSGTYTDGGVTYRWFSFTGSGSITWS